MKISASGTHYESPYRFTHFAVLDLGNQSCASYPFSPKTAEKHISEQEMADTESIFKYKPRMIDYSTRA
jgi:hypothetical protein